MKNILLFLTLLTNLASCSSAQEKNAKQYMAVCQQGAGCEILELKASAKDIDMQLEKTGFWVNATDSSTLVIENCSSRIEDRRSPSEIHQSYGGKGEPKKLNSFDIQKHLKEKGCLSCPNTTKKMSFYLNASGEDAFSGEGYFFLNLKAGEAYMPNESFQKIYGPEAKQIVVDQFIRNGAMDSYTIAEGQKYHTRMPVGTNISVVKNDELNEQRFKKEFKKTGNTRKHLNTNETDTEYVGNDDEGKPISFWLVPVADVCLPAGKFDAFGFYNLGYISVDGKTYLVTEISGSGFQVKLTGISDGSYSFNPAGYKSY